MKQIINEYIWHPFTQMKTAAQPVHIDRGEGALLYDTAGKIYIDAISSWWTNIHGHANPYIAKKLFEQAQTLEHVIFAGFTHTPAIELAQRLVEDHLPSDISKIFYSDNGSTAVEVAIKMAIQYWQNIGQPKKKIIAFEHAYHGDTFGSMSVSGRGEFTRPFHSYLFDVMFIPPPLPGEEKKSITALSAALQTKDIAAFIYEPLIMGAGGMLMYTAEPLNELLRIAKENDTLCIADEVMTGFYRTGRMFASDHLTIKPDIMCLSKGLTGGTMAMGITACSQKIFDAFYNDDKMKAFYHGHSFTANPLACTAALASLDLLEDEKCKDGIDDLVKNHKKFAAELQNCAVIENVRQTGTILAFDLVTDTSTDYFNQVRDRIYAFFMDAGILLRPLGNTIYIMPPYCISEKELHTVYRSILEFLKVNLSI